MELRYKNYRLDRVNKEDGMELRNFFGGIKNGCSAYILNPKYILPEDVLDAYRETNELDFYDILPAEKWADEKTAYMTMYPGFFDSNVSNDLTTFMKRIKHDLEYIGDTYRVKNPQLNFVTVEDLKQKTFTKRAAKVKHFSMVRGLMQMRWEDGLNIAVNPDYAKAKMERFQNSFALYLDETDSNDPKYLLASQKLIDERQKGSRKLHTSIFDLDKTNDIAK
jgi:hypothetical protein